MCERGVGKQRWLFHQFLETAIKNNYVNSVIQLSTSFSIAKHKLHIL